MTSQEGGLDKGLAKVGIIKEDKIAKQRCRRHGTGFKAGAALSLRAYWPHQSVRNLKSTSKAAPGGPSGLLSMAAVPYKHLPYPGLVWC